MHLLFGDTVVAQQSQHLSPGVSSIAASYAHVHTHTYTHIHTHTCTLTEALHTVCALPDSSERRHTGCEVCYVNIKTRSLQKLLSKFKGPLTAWERG